MSKVQSNLGRLLCCVLVGLCSGLPVAAQNPPVARFDLARSPLAIERPVQPRNPFSVVGESGAILGQQDGSFELWRFPVKLLAHLHIKAELANYAVPIDVNALATTLEVEPDHTTITYSHAAFTVKQHMFVARTKDAGPVVLFEIASVRPLQLTIQFDPVMQRMWPALNPGRPDGEWVPLGQSGAYLLHTDDPFFNAMVAMPGTRAGILPPYQERPKDYPLEFKLNFDPAQDSGMYFPLITTLIDGGPRGREAGLRLKARTEELLQSVPELYRSTRDYYAHFFDSRLTAETPDPRLDQAMRWAEISVDQLKVSHGAELGLVAGVYTSADSDRPGFGWFFGRDTLWTLYAVHSYGDFSLARHALEFLIARQRADGKIMHEYSQSAEKVDWAGYGYQFNAADSAPLFVMAMEDYLRASGDRAFVEKYWENVKRAYTFTRANDSDGDGIYDNSQGTAWVESWPPTMPKQELYLAALDQQSTESIARMAQLLGDRELAASAHKQAELIRGKLAGYLGPDGIYAFSRNPDGSYDHTPTIFPSVAWWSGDLALPSADKTFEMYAGHDLSADWGERAVAQSAKIYDPISYHQGSVWPLFTGWASLAEYRTARPLAGYQHLMANADLTWAGDPGNVTELLSGAFNEPLGRSTAHQLWSSAMVLSPAIRGLFGVEADVPHHTLRVAPQLPAEWNGAKLHNVPFGDVRLEIALERRGAEMIATVTSSAALPLCLITANGAAAADCTQQPSTRHTLSIPLPEVEIALPHLVAAAAETDCAPRVVSQQYGPRKLTFVVEMPSSSSLALPVRINLPRAPKLTVAGAELRDGHILLNTSAGSGYQRKTVEVRW